LNFSNFREESEATAVGAMSRGKRDAFFWATGAHRGGKKGSPRLAARGRRRKKWRFPGTLASRKKKKELVVQIIGPKHNGPMHLEGGKKGAKIVVGQSKEKEKKAPLPFFAVTDAAPEKEKKGKGEDRVSLSCPAFSSRGGKKKRKGRGRRARPRGATAVDLGRGK